MQARFHTVGRAGFSGPPVAGWRLLTHGGARRDFFSCMFHRHLPASNPVPIRVILGLYRDNGTGNGNYCLGFRV